MAATTTVRAPGTRVPPFATRTVLPIAAVVAAAHLVTAAVTGGYWFDEAYMLAIGRHHLDWGSVDQPPLTPLLAALADLVAPGSLLALRVPAVLATAGAVVVAALVARELGGDRRAQALTAGAQATTLWITLMGHFLTPYALEPVQWLTLVWLLLRWMRTRRDRLLLVLGVVAGVAAQTKFHVMLLCAVLLVGVAVFGPRELLRRPLLWAGALIGASIAAPTLVWQAANGWPQLRMGPVAAAEAEFLYGGRPGVAVLLIGVAGVAGLVLGAYGLVRLLRSAEHRFLGVAFVALYAFFVVTGGRPYYLGGLYAVLAAAGAVGLMRRRLAGRRRWSWTAWPAYAVSALAAGALLLASIPAAEPGAGQRIADVAASAYGSQQQPTAIIGQSYIYSAYIEAYGGGGLPPVHGTNRAYGWFPPPPEDIDAAIYVGSSPAELAPYFTEVEELQDSDGLGAWLLSGRTQPWETIWAERRNLVVS